MSSYALSGLKENKIKPTISYIDGKTDRERSSLGQRKEWHVKGRKNQDISLTVTKK